ncbi:MAG: hypothetical protein LBE04_01830 [Prevotellaceae bacterium]|jgi:hypothetical protein|nr:hypothetical protein [Prevotellaceae bacterium]
MEKVNEYPKLLGIGWNPMWWKNDKGTLIYLLEDEELFYGYAQDPDFNPRVKPSHFDVGALRWCQAHIHPKGAEDVQKLYREAMEIIKGDEELLEEWLQEKNFVKKTGKGYWINNETLERTLANPDLLKHFF